MIPAPEIKMIVSELGVTANWSAAYTANSGPQDAVVKIQLTDAKALIQQEQKADDHQHNTEHASPQAAAHAIAVAVTSVDIHCHSLSTRPCESSVYRTSKRR